MIPYIYSKNMKENLDETTMVVLPLLKVRRHTPIILSLFLLFTKNIKEGNIIKRHSWIDREVASFSIQAHHIPAVGVLVLVLIRLYIDGGIYKSVNWYGCWWEVGGVVFSIDVEFPIDWTVDSRNGGCTIVGAPAWFFLWSWNNQCFYLY